MAKGGKKNSRKQGLEYVREVKKILEGRGWLVDGPFFKSVFIPAHGGKPPRQVVGHVDIFGVGDLLVLFRTAFHPQDGTEAPSFGLKLGLVQVTTVDNEASHFEALDKVAESLPVLLFVRCKIDNQVVYRVKNRLRERLGGFNLKGEFLNVVQCWEH